MHQFPGKKAITTLKRWFKQRRKWSNYVSEILSKKW